MEFLSDLWLYVQSVVGGQWAYLTGGPFVLDELLKKFWPWWANLKWPGPALRRKIELAIVVTGFLYANFTAWEQEHRAVVDARLAQGSATVALAAEQKRANEAVSRQQAQSSELDRIKKDLSRLQAVEATREAEEWPALSDGQRAKWFAELRAVPGLMPISVFYEDDGSKKLRMSIAAVFQRFGASIPILGGGSGISGIRVRSRPGNAEADRLVELLNADGYPVQWDTGPSATSANYDPRIVYIDIGTRPPATPIDDHSAGTSQPGGSGR